MDYQDITLETKSAAAWITINRPDKYNAFRGRTCEELIHAFNRAGWDKSVAVIVLTGAGSKRFAPEATNRHMTVPTMAAARSACRSRSCKR